MILIINNSAATQNIHRKSRKNYTREYSKEKIDSVIVQQSAKITISRNRSNTMMMLQDGKFIFKYALLFSWQKSPCRCSLTIKHSIMQI